MTRSINAAGLALIKSFESFRSYPYKDSAGIWTIGYGHTKGVNAWTVPITEDQAEDFLLADVTDAEAAIERLIYIALNDNQFSALVSLIYNVGTAPLTHTLGALLNEGNYSAVADQFLRWNHAGGVVSDGLTRRRVAERNLFLLETIND
jgi:lysozyme